VLEYHSFRGAVFEALISIDAVQPQLETERVLWNSSVGKAANAPYQQYGETPSRTHQRIHPDIQNKFSPSNLSTYSDSQAHDKPINTFNANPSSTHSDSTLDEFK